ncbi:MAG TPA: Rieske 2Fe-2S domain-containing protein [Burkholderiales bacterium]|jgi:vanillate O-demethylase monooxygenase subunit
MFLKNTWYVAAWDHEVSRQPLARKLLDIPVVLYRTQAGAPVALEDTCPHRFYPLSKGTLKGDALECGYHGMTFDCSGKCVHIPGQEQIPPTAAVRSFPVAERWGWIWIWMGDPALADAQKIIDIPQLRSGEWTQCRGERMYYRGNYQLMTDNLMDPSHVSYVHRSTFGTNVEATLPVKTQIFKNFVAVTRVVPDSAPAPFFQRFGKFTGKVHRWQVYRVIPPSLCIIDTGSVESRGDDGSVLDLAESSLTDYVKLRDGDDRKLLAIRGFDFLTPETETSTHYFWFLIRNFGLGDRYLERQVIDATTMAFAEDVVVAEGIQQRVNGGTLPRQVNLRIDAGSTQVRRMLDKMIAAENEGIKRMQTA